jgi:hypothetical protein
MKKTIFLVLSAFISFNSFSQRILLSWSQQNIENYTKEMYDKAQRLTTSELLTKNLNDESWSAVFLTQNASINNYSTDSNYLKGLANQVTNLKETILTGTSRLIIWDRIVSGDIIFEGKGLLYENDLFKVGGRANQILQNLTHKNFGYVTINSTEKDLEEIQNKWLSFLSNITVEEYTPIEYPNAKILEICSLSAVHALIISLQDNPVKNRITKNCLKKVYDLDKMPKEKGSSAMFCNPDTYTFANLAILFGDYKYNETKDAKWWLKFWNKNQNNLVWNDLIGIYELKK